MTAVDWNPIDSNQLITCSDDNTIRVWNVKRDLDMLKANECNFCIAQTIDEFEDDRIEVGDSNDKSSAVQTNLPNNLDNEQVTLSFSC